MEIKDIGTIFVTFAAGGALMIIIKRLFRRQKPGICKNNNSLEGKTVVITGANSGIGLATAKDLAKRKARIILACRDVHLGEKAIDVIRNELGNATTTDLAVKQLDLSSFKSIQTFAKDVTTNEPKIDILINNAGVFGFPFSHTENGVEMTFGVNHLGHFLLTNLLMDKLASSSPSRIIIVASKLYERANIDFHNLNAEKFYDKRNAYGQSKLANLLFAHELNKRLPEGITVNSLHPGFAKTNLPRHMLSSFLKRFLYPVFAFLFMRSATEGAQTVIYLATSDDVAGVSGKYFGDCKEEMLKQHAMDSDVAKQLWDVSEKLCGLDE